MDQQDKQYTKGFNDGYLIAKHEPELVTKIVTNIHPTTDYIDGFLSGKDELELEKSRTQIEDLSLIRNQSKDRTRDLDREI